MTLLIVSEPPAITFTECDALKAIGILPMVSRLSELSKRPPVVVIELPLSVKAGALALKVSPKKKPPAMSLLSVNVPAPCAPNTGVSPVAGGVLTLLLPPLQFKPVFQLLSPAPPVQVSLVAFRLNAPANKSRPVK